MMRHLSTMFSFCFLAAISTPALAQPVTLVDGCRPGDVCEVKATLQVVGQLTAPTEASQDVGLSAKCQVVYTQGLSGRDGEPALVAHRRYGSATAQLRVGAHEETNALPSRLSLIQSSLKGKTLQHVSPDGPLSRGEIDTLTLPGDPLTIYRLLPGHPVEVGEQWTHESDDLAAVLNLEHVGINELTSELIAVENGLARMQLTGLVKGRVNGVATEMQITGDYRYDLHWKHINWLQLRIKEQRDESPIAPGFNVDAEFRMLIAPTEAAKRQLVQVDDEDVSARDRLLRYESHKGGYEFLHGLRWYVVDERARHAAWRIVDGDNVIAQCNAIRLKDLQPGKQLSLEEFQADIQQALGKQFGQFESANQKQRKDGNQVLRVIARGIASEVPVRWIYYHVCNDQGQRANLVFVMNVKNSDYLGKDDVIAASTLRITGSAAPATPEEEVAEAANSAAAATAIR